MLDRDQMKQLHNTVTELHKSTSLAATGSGAIDLQALLGLVAEIINLIKDNFGVMQNELRRGSAQAINEATETRFKEHEEAITQSAQPRHPNTPQRAGFAENIAETTKGNPPNPPLKAEGSPPERSPVNNQNDPTNPDLNKIEESKNNPPEKVEQKPGGEAAANKPNPTDLTIKPADAAKK